MNKDKPLDLTTEFDAIKRRLDSLEVKILTFAQTRAEAEADQKAVKISLKEKKV